MKQFHILLKRFHLLRDLVLCAAAIHSNTHPDRQLAVHGALSSHALGSVTVDQDKGKGVIRLTGVVANSDSKDRAQQLAQQAAPGYTIDNQIQVNRAGLL
jgi:BON domain